MTGVGSEKAFLVLLFLIEQVSLFASTAISCGSVHVSYVVEFYAAGTLPERFRLRAAQA